MRTGSRPMKGERWLEKKGKERSLQSRGEGANYQGQLSIPYTDCFTTNKKNKRINNKGLGYRGVRMLHL
jgi:hypothetical protein